MRPVIWAGWCCLALAVVGARTADVHRGEGPAPKWPRIDQSQYAGSTKCAECHKTHYDNWKDTAHNKMIRPPISEGPNRTVLADFSQPSPLRDFELRDVKWVIGHGPGKDPGPQYKTLSDHTHHGPLSTGSRCIECHMPKTGTNAVAGESRNHTFDFISPSETIKTGGPNSCTTCHADKSPQWALVQAKKWYPKLK
jgi:hypothetical protein